MEPAKLIVSKHVWGLHPVAEGVGLAGAVLSHLNGGLGPTFCMHASFSLRTARPAGRRTEGQIAQSLKVLRIKYLSVEHGSNGTVRTTYLDVMARGQTHLVHAL